MAKNVVARRQAGWKVIGSRPDVCKTPMGSSTPPVPYCVFAELVTSGDEAKSVRSNSHALVVLDATYVPATIGDAAGVANGVSSGKVGGRCYPAESSRTVRAEKRLLVRHGDKFEMNAP